MMVFPQFYKYKIIGSESENLGWEIYIMQIGAGWAKGLQLQVPKGDATRPTAAKVRAALFNSLQAELEDAKVLDLFSGSGALGIEAMSRGARAAVFVEVAPAALKALKLNVAELTRRASKQSLPEPGVEVLGREVAVAVGQLVSQHSKITSFPPDLAYLFDLIFIDPPYKDVIKTVPELLPQLAKLAKPTAVLVLESSAEAAASLEDLLSAGRLAPWVLVKQKTYGDTMISMFSQDVQSE